MNGIEAFSKERQHQIDKHGFTGEHHANHPEWYEENQLIEAAKLLATPDLSGNVWYPKNWDSSWFYDLCRRDHKERLEISGALLAAEYDRLEALAEKEA
jgi:hypothetical protein